MLQKLDTNARAPTRLVFRVRLFSYADIDLNELLVGRKQHYKFNITEERSTTYKKLELFVTKERLRRFVRNIPDSVGVSYEEKTRT